MSSYFRCNNKDIAELQTREFSVKTDQGQLELFIVSPR
jgi:hypothetical protein